jgi:CpeT protein
MNRIFSLCAACLATLVAGGCSSQPRTTGGAAPIDAAVEWLSGSFSSQAQSEADPDNYADIRLFMTPIWEARGGGRWLYVEQASASSLDRPYRQRVYRVTAEGPETIRSDVYTLPGDPRRFAGAWRDPSMLDGVTLRDLTLRDGCSILMRYDPDGSPEGSFVGSTVGDGCASVLRGAEYATSDVVLTPNRLETWDRGYDAGGDQVWGARRGPYVFDRIGP